MNTNTNTNAEAHSAALTGRVRANPGRLLHDEVLTPQFQYELRNLLPWYLAIEKVLLTEYVRMRLIAPEDAAAIGGLLDAVDERELAAQAEANLSDIAFSIERYVEPRLTRPVPVWHVDRSRNDLQACAQLLFGRARLAESARLLQEFGEVVCGLAERTRESPMPGYTHFQAAQIITPGFYLAALGEQVTHFSKRLSALYDSIDRCPLGAGAMAGQHLPWDRDAMAALLGFGGVHPSALGSVASRGWVLEATAELSLIGCVLSRFATDLLAWGGSEHGFIDLPDELAGISSAMPQKKNFPVLERIRGRTAHLSGFHVGVLLGQRNTPFSNLVEVSKEAGAHLSDAFDCFDSVLRLFTTVVGRLEFRTARMLESCEREFFGGFALANELTLTDAIPWRQAQVVAGRYVVAAVEAGLSPRQHAPALLVAAAAEAGFVVTDPGGALAEAFDVERSLHRMASAGSTHPDAVVAVLRAQAEERERLRTLWRERDERVLRGAREVDRLLPGLEPSQHRDARTREAQV